MAKAGVKKICQNLLQYGSTVLLLSHCVLVDGTSLCRTDRTQVIEGETFFVECLSDEIIPKSVLVIEKYANNIADQVMECRTETHGQRHCLTSKGYSYITETGVVRLVIKNANNNDAGVYSCIDDSLSHGTGCRVKIIGRTITCEAAAVGPNEQGTVRLQFNTDLEKSNTGFYILSQRDDQRTGTPEEIAACNWYTDRKRRRRRRYTGRGQKGCYIEEGYTLTVTSNIVQLTVPSSKVPCTLRCFILAPQSSGLAGECRLGYRGPEVQPGNSSSTMPGYDNAKPNDARSSPDGHTASSGASQAGELVVFVLLSVGLLAVNRG